MREEADSEKKAVVLLSGGLDSTTVLAIAGDRGYACYCLSFSYGQRQDIELRRARESAEAHGARAHLVLEVGLGAIGGSALTSHEIDVPKDSLAEAGSGAIPVTYVPGRNTIFLAYAVSWAEVIGARDIFIGVNAMDYSGYPDCRPEFIRAFESVANLGTKAGSTGDGRFVIHAPLLRMTKKEIIETGLALGVDYARTHSCYDPSPEGLACGRCDACLLRLKGFAEAGLNDPAGYRK